MDTVYFDVSNHQPPLTDKVLSWKRWSRWAAIRVCDGTFRDTNFLNNFGWLQALKRSQLVGYIVYLVFPPSASNASVNETFATFQAMVGNSFHQRMVRMIDVERWKRWSGDHSR